MFRDDTLIGYFWCMNFSKADLQKQVTYKVSRSGGKGGQNVNKVATKVELLFPVSSSGLFNDEEKQILNEKLAGRINSEGLLQVICDEERSQYLNKEIAIERLCRLIANALHKNKPRKKTRISAAAKAAP